MAQSAADVFWQPGDQGAHPDRTDRVAQGAIYKPEFFEHISSTIAALDKELFALSQDIHGEPSEYHSKPYYRLTGSMVMRTQIIPS